MENVNQQVDQEDKNPLTPEEILERRKVMLAFYNDQKPLLEAQKLNENLMADIEEARLRRVRATLTIGQMMAPPIAEQPKAKDSDPIKKV